MPVPALTLFHAPNSRSTAAYILLEELAAPFELHIVNIRTGEQRQPDFLAVNPMGKVPAVRAGDAIVTEQVAIFIYLADLFPAAGLAPAFDDALRGPYLRWLAYYAACLEPALVDHASKREPLAQPMSPYGSYEAVVKTVIEQLQQGPFLLGERFTAADVLWGTALGWMTQFKIFPEDPAVLAYVARVAKRPAAAKVRAHDEELAAALPVPDQQPG